MRYAAIAVLCISLSLSGIYVSDRHRKKQIFLSELADFFSDFASCGLIYGTDAAECIEYLAEKESYRMLTFLSIFNDNYVFGCNIRELWKSSVKKSPEILLVDKASREMLQSFAEILGKGSMNDFAIKCREVSQYFRNAAEKEARTREKNSSLYVSSGIFAAAAVFIILL